jgi:hypothetical protein
MKEKETDGRGKRVNLRENIQIEKERMRQTETDGERANVTDRER